LIAVGLDPSVRGFGWAVIRDEVLERCGVWSTEKGHAKGLMVSDDNADRFGFISRCLVELVEQLRATEHRRAQTGNPSHEEPVTFFVEALGVFGDRFTTACAQGRCLGLIDGVAASLLVPLHTVQPSAIKRLANSGARRKVDKDEVRAAVERIYPNAAALIPAGKVGDNASDAVALAHVGAAEVRFRASLRPGSPW
jgi:Holliday junction resolvasome RuvABC endonuclease subunit